MKARKLFSLLTIFLLSTISIFGQSYLVVSVPASNIYPITFTDAAQVKLTLNFTKNVTPGANISQIGWSVTGTAATINRIDAAGTNVVITLNSAITFAERANVKVTYSAALGSFSMQDLTEPDFSNISAVNNAFAAQSDFANGLYGELPPTDICAPVLAVDVSSNIIIGARYRNSIHFRTPRMTTLWMYPAIVPKTEPDYVETGGVGTGIFSKTNTFASYPDNTINCTWQISIYPYIPAQAPAPQLSVTDRQVFITIPNYKLDNGTPAPGTGSLALNPPIDDPTTLFCVGKDITAFTFTDGTVFDCQFPLPEANLPNTRDRYVQYVYGTQVGAGIPNTFINVFGTPVQITDASGNPMPNTWTVNPATGGAVAPYSTVSGFFEGPVVNYQWDAGTKARITPLATTYPISHTGSFVTDAAGQIFDVTLRNWGPCNPYDAMDPFTYIQSVTKVSRLRLILSPPAPTIGPTTYCFGSVPLTLDATGTTGTLKWWTNAAMTTPAGGAADPYTHGQTAVGSYPFWVNETLGTGCAGPALPVTLVINPLPTITTTGTMGALCSSAAVQNASLVYTATGNTPTSYSIDWNAAANTAGLADQGNTGFAFAAGGGTLNTIVITAGTPGGAYSGTMTIRTASGCTSTQAVTITINPLPTITTTGTITALCFNAAVQNATLVYTATANTPTSYSIDWNAAANTAGLADQGNTGFAFAAGGGNLNTIVITAGTPGGTYNGTMTILNGNGCTNTQAVTITINPLPTITTTGTMTALCFSAAVQNATLVYTATGNSPTSYSINWNAAANAAGLADQGNTGFAFAAGGGNLNTIVITAGTPAGAYSGTMTITTAAGCTATQAVTITVNPLPTITTTGTITPLCFNAAVQNATLVYTATGNSPTSYSIDWNAAANTAGLADQGNTGFAFAAGGGNLNTIVITAGTPGGTYNGTMTILNGNGCTNTQAVSIVINPLPTITTTGTMTALCFSAAVQNATLVYTATGNSPTSYSINWNAAANAAGLADQGNTGFAFAAGGGNLNTIVITAGTPVGTYSGTMTITTAAGCTSTQAVTITINPLPTITTTGTMGALCSSAAVQNASLVYTATGNTPTSYSIDWNAAANTAGLADQGNTGFAFAAGGGTLNTIVITAGTPGGAYSGTMTITTAAGCTATQAVTITINPLPTITTTGTITALCFNAAVQNATLVYTATGNSPTSYSIDWNAAANTAGLADQGNTGFAFAAGGGNLNTIVITAGTPGGTYNGTMTILNGNGCTNTQAVTITINPLPTITTTGTMTALCFSAAVQNATLVYTATGNSPTSYSINWNAAANAAGLADQGNTGFAFAAGGGNLNTIVITAGTPAGAYSGTMTITTAAGCTATQAVTITVNPLPTITTTGTITPLCFNAAVQNATLVYTATGNSPTSYSIDWNAAANTAGLADQGNTGFAFAAGGGNLNTIVITAGTPGGTYNGTMTILNGNGCTNTQAVSIVINPLPTITTTGTITALCFSAAVQNATLVYTATANSPTSYSINWNAAANAAGLADQGNTGFAFAAGGGNLNTIVITAATPAGTYSGTMTITNGNGCTNTQAVTITINPGKPAVPTITGVSPVCQGQTGVVYSVVNDPIASNYIWAFDPVLVVTPSGPTNLNSITVGFGATAATGNVTVTAANGCGDNGASLPFSITVNQMPTITTTGTMTALCFSAAVQNATLVYTATGNSPTSYSIDWNAAANTAGLADQGNTGFAFAAGGGNLNTIVITAGTPGGTYNGTMTILNGNGCTNTQAVSIVINPLPTITSTGTITALCFNAAVQNATLVYTATGNSPTSYSIDWNAAANTAGLADQGNTGFAFAAGGGNLNTIVITAATPAGTYSGTMTILNGNGCTNTKAVTITINPLPTITTTGTVTALCFSAGAQSATLVYTATGNSPTSYSIDWNAAANTAGLADQGNTGFAFAAGGGNLNTIAITASTPAGTYSGTMTILNGNGCTNTQAVTITINPLPTITTTGTITPLCFNAAVQNATLVYTATGNSPTSYSIDWNAAANTAGLADQGNTGFAFAAGGGNLNTIVITAGTPGGTYNGTMTILNGNGCTNTQAVSIVINPLPTITSTGTITALCFNAAVQNATLVYTATGNSPTSYSIDWNAAANTAGLADQGNTGFAFAAGGGNLNTIVITAATPAGTYSGTMTILNGNGCTNTKAVTITINPLPTITTTGTVTALCFSAGAQSATLVYTATGNSPTSYSIDWNAAANTAGLADQGNTGFAFAAGGGNLNTIAITASTPAGTYSGTMTILNGNGCTNTQAVTITINPLPTITTTGTITALCFNAAVQNATLVYTATGNSPTSYSIDWNAAANTAGLADQGNTGFAFAAGGGNLNTIVITAGTPGGTYNGTMTILNGNGCTNTQAVSIVINPLPTITSTGTITALCFNAAVQNATLVYTATGNSPTSYSIDWNAAANTAGLADQGNTGFAFAAGGGNLNTIVITAATPAGTYSGTMTILNGNGCTNTKAVTITINPLPTITTTGTVTALCFSAGAQSATLVYTATGNSPTSYSIDWNAAANTAGLADQGNTGFAFAAGGGNLNTIAITASTPAGTYSGTMTILNGNGCTNTQAVTITINPLPTITTTGTITALCFSAAVQNATLAYTATANTPTSYSIDWNAAANTAGLADQGNTGFAFAAGGGNLNTIVITAGTPGGGYSGTMTITTAAGCTATQAVTITINPLPTITSTGTITALCFNAAVQNATLVYTATGNSPTSYSIDWNAAANTAGLADQGNTGFAFAAGGGNLNTIVITAATPAGTYSGTMTILNGNGCTNTKAVTITINPLPTITTTGTVTALCFSAGAQSATLVYTATGNSPTSYSIDWNAAANTAGLADQGNTGFAFAAGGGNLNTIAITASTPPGTYSGTMTILNGNGCTNTQAVTITINPLPTITTTGTITALCFSAGVQNATLVYTATANSPTSYSINWNAAANTAGLADQANTGFIFAAGGGNLNTIVITAATPAGTYSGTMTILNGNGCANTQAVTIIVHPIPTLSTTLTPADVCSNSVFSYNPASATPTTTFNWTRASIAGITPVGPTSGTDNPNETLVNITSSPIPVTYQYTLLANGCSNVQNVVVNIKPEPVITAAQNPSACSGNALNYKILMNNFTNPADLVTFTWGAPVLAPVNPLFTGGSARLVASGANITDTYINTTGLLGTATYSVTPYKNGCAGTPVNVVITVGSQPVLDNLDKFACSNTAIALTLKEAAGSVVPTYYNIISKTVAGGLTDVGNAAIPNATAPDNYLFNDKYTNATGVNKTVTYRVQPILAPDCIGAAVDVVITIRPQPVIFPAQTKTVCSSVAVAKEILLTPANIPAGSTLSWPLPVMSDASVQGTTASGLAADPAGTIHINDILHNYSSAAITATYSVTPTSSFGCVGASSNIIITVNPEPVPQPITGRDKICVNDPNVVYNVTAVAGSTFHWTVDAAVGTKTFDFNTNAILINGAAAAGSGNITVYETNSFACNGAVSTKAVQVYAVPAAEAITGNAIVCANSTNVYTMTFRAGSVYSWSVPGGAAIVGDPTANSITVIFAGTGGSISVTETNAAGCVRLHTPKAITVNTLPTATISGGGTMCVGGSRNLSVDFTGTGPYTFTYAIDGVSQVPVATASDPYTLVATAPGNYTIVNVSDANCTNTGTGSTLVSYFPQPTGIISGSGEYCNGSSKTLTMTFTGTAPFTFTYTDGTTPVTVVNHATSVYTVNVSPLVTTTYTLTALTDNNTCTGVLSGSAVVSVNQPPALTLTGTNLICYNVPTGAVNMAVAGGTAPFGYSWTGPSGFTAATQNISALAAGYYAAVVTDSKGCTGTANITLTQPPLLTGSAAGTNITCFGANDGTITVSGIAGGSGTYEYTSDGGTIWQAGAVFSALSPGTYNVKMRDAVNPTCILPLNGALVLTQPAVLNATVTPTNSNCFGASNGSIIITAPTGGYGTYGYSINGGGAWSGSGNFTNVGPGTYNVQIRDAANPACVKTLNGALVITEPAVLAATLASTNVTCSGANDGTITISAPTGGLGTYEYSINSGGSWQAVGTYTNLAPGTHNVQIRDAVATGCFKVLNAALTITQPAILSATVASTNVTCNGAADGTITISAPAGGYGTYEYSINGGGAWQASGSFGPLAPGTYDVRMRDAAHTGCTLILNAGLTITQPLALSASVIDTDISCFGSTDGVIQITSSAGGYGTYQYSIDGGGTWQDAALFPGLAAGVHNVKIRDKAHTACVVTVDPAVTITAPAVLNAAVASTNVTCNSASDGTITISGATGGYGTYGYSVNGGASWQGSGNFTNLTPGSYTVKIRDAANTGCIITLGAPVVITEPAALSGSLVKTNVNCFGAADGTITITAAGGYGTYDYTINGGATWQASNSFTALIPGFYNVKIRDAANIACIATINGSLNVTEPAILNATVAKTNVTCNGSNNGTITISSPTGGYGTYEYSVNGAAGPWQASGNFTLLPPATYNVMIRDAAHPTCTITLNGALAITEPAVLAATVNSTDVTCFGSANGTITVTGATGGYGTYEYTVTGGATWTGLGNFTNRAPGVYDVRIRDAANPSCVITLNGALSITQPAVLSATVAKTNVTCFGAADGTITITAPLGGYGTYEYSINGGGAWQGSGTFTALAAGNYNVQIRDAAHNTCVIVLNNSLQITQPSVLNAVVTPTMVTCNGASDGKITITAPTGGYGTYNYSVNGGVAWQASGNFTGLAPATYDVRIQDAANPACVIILNNTLTITEPAAVTASVNSTDITCFGANNGTITVSSPTGGYGTYEYSKNGGGAWQATGNFTALIPGTYDVRIRDKAHIACVTILNGALLISEPAVLNAAVASTNVTCFGANNGTISITAPTGGYGTYGYSINGGATWQSSGSFINLAPGTYAVKIRDAVNTTCTITLNAGLVITQPAVLSATVAKTNVTCNGAGDGTVSITAPAGGYGTYEYSIDGGTTWQASGSFSALVPGFYNVQIRDGAQTACVVILSGALQITQPSALSGNLASTNITCNSVTDGTITVSSPSGGYGTYEYSVNGAAGPWQASGSFTGLTNAVYNVQMRDAAHTGCVLILNPALAITRPAALTATVTPTMITCNGAGDGIITISAPAGGYGTYQYSKNGGTSWQGSGVFTNLAPANYDVRIRDAANPLCEVTLNAALAITQPAILSATLAKTNVTCFGGSDGTITISAPTGGYGTYEYSINGGGSWQASGNFTALVPGTYNVQIRDAAHSSCVIVLNASYAVTQPGVLNGVVTPTMVSCNGANDGIIAVTAPTGGSGSFEYSKDGGTLWQPGGTFNALAPGSYNIQIRDALNITCIIVLNTSVTITEPSAITATVSSTNVTCNGANNGTITVSFPLGGYGTYEYSKDGAAWQATGTFSGLAPATYNVQIRDKAHIGCVTVLNGALVITQPAALSATLASTNVTCFGANNGTITVSAPLGGYGTYEYSVNGGATWQASGNFTNLAPATYNVKMRDAANVACILTLNGALVITQPPVLSATVASTNVTCFGAGDGTITITSPLGGYGTYEYSVSGGTSWQGSGSFTALIPGFYNVQIRDAAQPTCVITLNGSLQITQPQVLSAFVSKTDVTCNGGSDGTITVAGATGGYGTFEYSINGGGTWQVSGSFSGLAPASYNVQMRDGAHTGCVKILNAALVITQPAVMTATVTPTMATCNGANDAIITISAPAGGYGTYQYSVNGGTSWQGSGTFTNLAAPASYDVRIRDAANPGCVITLNAALALTQPAVLSASIASTPVTCFGGGDGTITISAPAGGYGTYEYSINGGGSWQASGNFTALTPGSYNILIRDAAHTTCVKVLNNAYAVTQPALLSATVGKTDVTCLGAADGKINITAPSGGYGTYEYSINGGTSWQATGSYTALAPATYDVRIRDAAHTSCTAILYPNLLITEPLVLSMSSTGNVLLNCFNDATGSGTFFASGGTLPYTFSVTSNTTGATIAAPGFNSQSFFGAAAGTITVGVLDLHGCFASATINVTQPALLTPGSIGTNQVLCSGFNPAQLTETAAPAGGPGAYNYQWQYSTSAVGTFINVAGAQSFQYTPPAGATTTLYYRRMVTSGVCTPVYSNVVEVKVNPLPVAILTGGETICPAQTSILKVNMMVGTGPFELNILGHGIVTGYTSGADIVVSPVATTTYTLVSAKDANGCIVTSPSANLIGSATVTVRALPAITVSPVNKTICEFGQTSFAVTATGSDLTYQWYVNDGTGFVALADGGVYFGATGATLSIFGGTRLMTGYVYHAVVTGCSSSVTSGDATLTVNTVPEIATQPKDSTICLGANATFSVTATGTAITYKWQMNNVDIVNGGSFSGATTNTLTITGAAATLNNKIFRVIISGTCGVPVYSNMSVLRVNIPPTVTLNPVNKAACDGTGPVVFTGNGTGVIDSLRWQVNTGSGWSDIYDDAVYSGTTSQQLTLSNVPIAYNGFQYRLALKAKCVTATTTGATLTVNANPIVTFPVNPINACGEVPIVITPVISSGSGTWSTHNWTGDIGPLSNYFVQSPTFNSQIAATYNLNYKVKDNKGCFGNADVQVLVDAPDATFNQDINNGCTPALVTFTKDMTGYVKFWWDFGDGSPKDSVNANPVHTFNNASPSSIQYLNVKLTVKSAGGCLDTYTSNMTVYPAIDATFATTPAIICSGNTAVITAAKPGASKYFWDYGDGTSGYSPTESTTHVYSNLTTAPQVLTVTLTTTSFYNCTDVKTKTITVMPVPLPQFSAAPPSQVYSPAGNPVVFTNQTNAGTWTWLWKFGDGTTSSSQSPTHTYTALGTYNVVLTVSNANCSDSVKHQVSVTPEKPIANFDSIPSDCEPLTININNTTTHTDIPGTTYRWDFGDGGTSTAKNPTYTYFDPGTYKIELIVTGPGGTTNYSQVVSSYPSPKAYFEVAPTFVYVNDEQVRGFNKSQFADSYLWNWGDGDTSKLKDPYHKYMTSGTYDISLWAYSHNIINGKTIVCSDQYILSPGVIVEPAGEIRFATVFTPNLDGPVEGPPTTATMDQFFYPPIQEKVLDYKLQVFNRLGVLIFESRSVNIPWNGYYKGKLCNQGVYVWYVEGKYSNGKPFKKVGDITLLH